MTIHGVFPLAETGRIGARGLMSCGHTWVACSINSSVIRPPGTPRLRDEYNEFLYWAPSKTQYDIIIYVLDINIVHMFWYVVGTTVIYKMLKIMAIYPHLKGVIGTWVEINVQENARFSSQLVVATGTAVTSLTHTSACAYTLLPASQQTGRIFYCLTSLSMTWLVSSSWLSIIR